MALTRTDASPIAYTRGSKEILDPTNDTLGTQSELESTQGTQATKDTSGTLQPLKSDLYLTDELDDIERSIGSLTRFVPQVTDVEPSELYRGLIRYCKSPWDPIGSGYEGLVTYDGTSWTRLGLDYDSDISSLQAQITSNDGDISDLQANKADASHTHAYTDINGIDSGRLLGRTTASSGAAELITVGTGLTLSSGTLSASDQSKGVAVLRPASAIYPTSNYPQLVSRNGHDALAFDTSTQETVFFTFALPSNYTSQGLNVKVFFASDATSGTGGFDVAIDSLLGADIDSDTFDTTIIGTPITVSATAGTVMQQTIALADGDLDGASASGPVRMRLRRDTPNDTASSDLQVILVVVELQ